MGNSGSKKAPDGAQTHGKSVDRELAEQRIKELFTFKILLLGAGESGKSTVLKQLKLIHKVELEKENVLESLHCNVVDCMKSLLTAAGNFHVPIGVEFKPTIDKLKQWDDKSLMSPEFCQDIIKLYYSEPIQTAWKRRSEFWLLDSFEKFFDKRKDKQKPDDRMHIEHFCDEGFVPNDDDVCLARIRTTGIHVAELKENIVQNAKYESNTLTFQVVDVGGQRSERRKWLNIFDDSKAVLFICNLAGYNQVLFEDNKQNRMKESLDVFDKIVNTETFKDVPIFVFLNKKDLFEKMLKEREMNKVVDSNGTLIWEDCTAGTDVMKALEYVQSNFEKKVPLGKKGNVKFEFISARHKGDVRSAFGVVKKILYNDNRSVILAEVAELKKGDKKGCCGGCAGGGKNVAV